VANSSDDGSDSSSSDDSDSSFEEAKNKKKKVRIVAKPNVITRSAAKRFDRNDAMPLSVKSGNLSKKIVAKDKKKKSDDDMKLTTKEKMDLLQSQPQDGMSDGDSDDSSMSSVDGLREMSPLKDDKNKNVKLQSTLPEDDSSSEDGDHFGV